MCSRVYVFLIGVVFIYYQVNMLLSCDRTKTRLYNYYIYIYIYIYIQYIFVFRVCHNLTNGRKINDVVCMFLPSQVLAAGKQLGYFASVDSVDL